MRVEKWYWQLVVVQMRPLLLSKRKVTITALVPPLAMIWLDAASSRNADLSSLEVMQVGGAKFSAEVAKRIRPTFDVRYSKYSVWRKD